MHLVNTTARPKELRVNLKKLFIFILTPFGIKIIIEQYLVFPTLLIERYRL